MSRKWKHKVIVVIYASLYCICFPPSPLIQLNKIWKQKKKINYLLTIESFKAEDNYLIIFDTTFFFFFSILLQLFEIISRIFGVLTFIRWSAFNFFSITSFFPVFSWCWKEFCFDFYGQKWWHILGGLIRVSWKIVITLSLKWICMCTFIYSVGRPYLDLSSMATVAFGTSKHSTQELAVRCNPSWELEEVDTSPLLAGNFVCAILLLDLLYFCFRESHFFFQWPEYNPFCDITRKKAWQTNKKKQPGKKKERK